MESNSVFDCRAFTNTLQASISLNPNKHAAYIAEFSETTTTLSPPFIPWFLKACASWEDIFFKWE